MVWRFRQYPLLRGAVGEKVFVYADDVALHQRIGPVAVDNARLCLCAVCEDVVLTEEEDGKKRGKGLEENHH